MPKSPDAFRTISEVADWLGIQAHVLRFWESKFTQVKPIKRAGGRRYYRPADMLLLGGIKRLLHDDGLTIKGVQKILREEGMSHVSALSMPLDDADGDTVIEEKPVPEQIVPAPAPEPEAVVLPFEPPKEVAKDSPEAPDTSDENADMAGAEANAEEEPTDVSKEVEVAPVSVDEPAATDAEEASASQEQSETSEVPATAPSSPDANSAEDIPPPAKDEPAPAVEEPNREDPAPTPSSEDSPEPQMTDTATIEEAPVDMPEAEPEQLDMLSMDEAPAATPPTEEADAPSEDEISLEAPEASPDEKPTEAASDTEEAVEEHEATAEDTVPQADPEHELNVTEETVSEDDADLSEPTSPEASSPPEPAELAPDVAEPAAVAEEEENTPPSDAAKPAGAPLPSFMRNPGDEAKSELPKDDAPAEQKPETQEAVPEPEAPPQPKPRDIGMPEITPEAEIHAEMASLAHAHRARVFDAETAEKAKPLLAQLAALRDRMAARRGGAQPKT